MSSSSGKPPGPGQSFIRDHLSLAALSTLLADRQLTGQSLSRTLFAQLVPLIRELLIQWEAMGRVKRIAEKDKPPMYLATVPLSELARLAAQASARIEWAERGQRAKRGGLAEAADVADLTEGGGA